MILKRSPEVPTTLLLASRLHTILHTINNWIAVKYMSQKIDLYLENNLAVPPIFFNDSFLF